MNSNCKKFEINRKKEVGNQKQKITFAYKPSLNTMKEIKLEINIEARKYNELTEEDRKLVDAACKATQRSYAPYSHFSVGAAACWRTVLW